MVEEETSIENIQEQLRKILPGENAHNKMIPPGRSLNVNSKKKAKQSAVLILLWKDEEVLKTCFIIRSSTMRNHAGQIGLPGGRYEDSDRNYTQTALRETYEEIGIEPDKIKILGKLTPLYVSVSNFLIHPYVGFINETPTFKIDANEVADLFTIPVSHFTNEQNQTTKNTNTVTGSLKVPCYRIHDKYLWGATAMIIAEFTQVIFD